MSDIEERIRKLIVCGWTRTEAINIIRNEDKEKGANRIMSYHELRWFVINADLERMGMIS